MKPPNRNEQGSVSAEAVIVVPVFLLLVGVLVLGGRIAIAQQVVQSAASDAARAASIARTAQAAQTDATTAAKHALANQHLDCATTSVSVDVTAFATTVGTPGQVHATVTCQLKLGDIGLPGVGGTKTVTATMSSPLDTYRER